MTELVRLKGVEAAVESTYATNENPTTSDGVQVEQNFWSEIEIGYLNENLREQVAQAGLGRVGQAAPTGRFISFTLMKALKGRSSAFSSSNVPEADPLLRSCGLSQTVDTTGGSETVTYEPTSSGFESSTVYLYAGGVEYQAVGVRGNVTLDFSPGGFVMATFDMFGLLDTDPSEAALPSITYPSSVEPPTVKSANLTMNSFSPDDFYSFELDPQVQTPELPGGNASDAHAGYAVSDWDPQFTTTISRPAKGSFDPKELQQNGTLFSWSIGSIGSAQYNQIDLSGPKGRIIEAPHSASDGFARQDLTVRCQNTDASTADDAFSLVFS